MLLNISQVKRVCGNYRVSDNFLNALNIKLSEMIEKSKWAIKSSKRNTLKADDLIKGQEWYRDGVPRRDNERD